jgi:hypothetical protein
MEKIPDVAREVHGSRVFTEEEGEREVRGKQTWSGTEKKLVLHLHRTGRKRQEEELL